MWRDGSSHLLPYITPPRPASAPSWRLAMAPAALPMALAALPLALAPRTGLRAPPSAR
jgi:hypothetical protein